MRDISDAADLMTTAREALLRDLLPALSGERRYAALMIANGMAIAAREHRVVSGCGHFVVGRFVPRARGLVDAAAVAGARIDRSSRFSD